MLCLPKPYGAPRGLSISIRSPAERHQEVAAIVASFGCPPFVLDRVIACIRHSGRYDCFVRLEVARVTREIAAALNSIGATLIVNETDSTEWQEHIIYQRGPLSELRLTAEGYLVAA